MGLFDRFRRKKNTVTPGASEPSPKPPSAKIRIADDTLDLVQSGQQDAGNYIITLPDTLSDEQHEFLISKISNVITDQLNLGYNIGYDDSIYTSVGAVDFNVTDPSSQKNKPLTQFKDVEEKLKEFALSYPTIEALDAEIDQEKESARVRKAKYTMAEDKRQVDGITTQAKSIVQSLEQPINAFLQSLTAEELAELQTTGDMTNKARQSAAEKLEAFLTDSIAAITDHLSTQQAARKR